MQKVYTSGFWQLGFYPFGSLMPGRKNAPEDYRYGFGGHEKDDEVKGDGNHISFDGYGYDPRLGRRFGLDPIDQVNISNYASFKNNPISFIDPNGRENIIYLVNLQTGDPKNHKVNADKLIKEVNDRFKALGLETRMVKAPKDFEAKYTDDTDSYVALGNVTDVRDFILKNNSEYGEFAYWGGGGNRNILLNDIKMYSQCLSSGGELYMSGFYENDIPAIEKECNFDVETKEWLLSHDQTDTYYFLIEK